MCFYWWVHTYTLAEGDTEVNEFPTVANKILKSHSEMYAHTHTGIHLQRQSESFASMSRALISAHEALPFMAQTSWSQLSSI